MHGRAFLEVARRLAHEKTEADWRSAAGRAYYALMLEARDILMGWGFSPLPRDPLHAYVRLRFVYAADPDLKQIGHTLEDAGQLRIHADYQLTNPGPYVSSRRSQQAVVDCQKAVALLDAIERDTGRRAAAIGHIRATLPP